MKQTRAGVTRDLRSFMTRAPHTPTHLRGSAWNRSDAHFHYIIDNWLQIILAAEQEKCSKYFLSLISLINPNRIFSYYNRHFFLPSNSKYFRTQTIKDFLVEKKRRIHFTQHLSSLPKMHQGAYASPPAFMCIVCCIAREHYHIVNNNKRSSWMLLQKILIIQPLCCVLNSDTVENKKRYV